MEEASWRSILGIPDEDEVKPEGIWGRLSKKQAPPDEMAHLDPVFCGTNSTVTPLRSYRTQTGRIAPGAFIMLKTEVGDTIRKGRFCTLN